ncbi:hypothetical protein lerEdw1_013145, partial [Lerista edwardsae]
MARPTHLNRNLPDLGGPFLYPEQDGEKASYSLETPYGFLLDLDFLKYVDDIERGQTLQKLPFHRKARGAKQAQSSSHNQLGGWTSTESLSSLTSEDGKPAFSPGPKMWPGSSKSRKMASKPVSVPLSPTPIINLLPPPPPKSLMRNAQVEKTLLETRKKLEQEQLNLTETETSVTTKTPNSPFKMHLHPQNCSPSSIPPTEESRADPVGFVRTSPFNSGRSTPATTMSPAHLHHIREQMAVALKQLKELEEQVKVIPVLEMKICKLKREKEQLVADLWVKSETDADKACIFNFSPQSPSLGAISISGEGCQDGHKAPVEISHDTDSSKVRFSKIAALKKLTERLSNSERVAKMGKGAMHSLTADEHTCKSVGVGEEIDMNDAVFYYRCQRSCQEVAVRQELETKDAEVWVMESLLGVSSETEEEIQLLQQTVQHQREVISMLEGHLKEATDELEELRIEVCSRRPKNLIHKETMAQPEMMEACTETVQTIQYQAVGGHVEMVDNSVLCSLQGTCVEVGFDLQQKGFVPVIYGDKATQVDLEVESNSLKSTESITSTLDQSTAENASPPEDAACGRLTGLEECGLARSSLGMEIPEAESCLLPQPTAKDQEDLTAQKGFEKSSVGTVGALKSIMKKQNGPPRLDVGSGKKSLQFMGVLNGEYESFHFFPLRGGGKRTDPEFHAEGNTSDEDFLTNLECSHSTVEGPVQGTMQDEAKLGHDKEDDEEHVLELHPPELTNRLKLSPSMRDACVVLGSHLGHGRPASQSKELLASTNLILQEWFRVSSQKSSLASEVAEHLLAFAEISPATLAHIINLSDGNGNTALHYSVSHSNFDIVQLLLDTDVCNVNHQNKAGYTALMLAALTVVEQEDDMAIVQRLFGMGNVNAKASQSGQTALMLAVSHGRQEMVEALLACGADINLQDEEGFTSLMRACEHGQAGTVRLLLAQQACNTSTINNDGNNAISIALEAGHHNLAPLISTYHTSGSMST